LNKNPLSNLSFLSSLNLLSFCLSCLILFKFLLKNTSLRIALFGLLIFLTGFNLYYAFSTFNESTSSLLLLLFLILNLETKPSWSKIIIISTIAGMSKEIIWPILLLIFIVAQLVSETSTKYLRNLIPTIIGIIISTLCNSLFNLYRFGTITNSVLLDPTLMVNNFYNYLSFFFGLIFSSSGGLLYFWPSLSGLIIFSLYLSSNNKRLFILNILTLSILIIQNAGLSKWFSPFGWVAWGPRLTFPILPSILLLFLFINHQKISSTIQHVLTHKTFSIILFLFLLITGTSHYAMLLFPQQSLNQLFAPNPNFPVPAIIQQDSAYYYRSVDDLIWRNNRILSDNIIIAVKTKTSYLIPYSLLLLALFLKLKKAK
jgi:hypothetical protein